MKAVLDVDGQRVDYPENVFTLEELLVHLMESDLMKGRFVVEVKVNGETFSEAYEHESREIELGNLSSIQIHTQGGEEFAETGLGKNPCFYFSFDFRFQDQHQFAERPVSGRRRV